MDSGHRAIEPERAAGETRLKDADQRILKDGPVLQLRFSQLVNDFLVPDEELIQGVQGFVPRIGKRARASALAEWARASYID
jgi:hypothetical protein